MNESGGPLVLVATVNMSQLEPSYAHPLGQHIGRAYPEAVDAYFQDDGVYFLSCSFGIWTMVSGFGLLESGRVSSKDEVNIMVKNVVDVLFGGLSYWAFGFGFTFGDLYPNPIIGFGKFFYDPDGEGNPSLEAWHYGAFFFQMSFATTTSTIVSAAMAERIRLKPYVVVTFLMTILHSVAAHWVWSPYGFLKKLGVVDAAGCSVVHLVGGVAGLASTVYLKPRYGRFGDRSTHQMSNPTNALLGTFMLWWGWLAFNTGSTYGVAQGKWRIASRSAVVTVVSSIGGGCTSLVISLIATKKCQVDLLIDGLLASLVATTAACQCIRPMESLMVGSIGSALALASYPLIERLEIDDPVGVIPVHVVAAAWGMISVGIFAQEDHYGITVTNGRNGLLFSGGVHLLLVQTLTVLIIFVWALVITFFALFIMDQLPWGLRMTKYEEQLGADLVEHGLSGLNVAKYNVEKPLTASNLSGIVRAVTKWKRLARRARDKRIASITAYPYTSPYVTGDSVVGGVNPSAIVSPLRVGTLPQSPHHRNAATVEALKRFSYLSRIAQRHRDNAGWRTATGAATTTVTRFPASPEVPIITRFSRRKAANPGARGTLSNGKLPNGGAANVSYVNESAVGGLSGMLPPVRSADNGLPDENWRSLTSLGHRPANDGSWDSPPASGRTLPPQRCGRRMKISPVERAVDMRHQKAEESRPGITLLHADESPPLSDALSFSSAASPKSASSASSASSSTRRRAGAPSTNAGAAGERPQHPPRDSIV